MICAYRDMEYRLSFFRVKKNNKPSIVGKIVGKIVAAIVKSLVEKTLCFSIEIEFLNRNILLHQCIYECFTDGTKSLSL